MTYLITQTLNGLFSAALLFLIASGLTLAFGVMKIVNIAHGSFYMLGVYVAYTVILRTGSLLAGALVALVVVGAVGFVMQRVFLRRFPSDPLAQMMMTMGFALLFRDAALMIWGGDPFTLPYPATAHRPSTARSWTCRIVGKMPRKPRPRSRFRTPRTSTWHRSSRECAPKPSPKC